MTDLVQSLLPKNELSIIAGASGAGKTSLTLQLIASLQKNTPFFNLTTSPGCKIGYIAADRGGDSLEYWAQRSGADLSMINTVSVVRDHSIVNLNKLVANPLAVLNDILATMSGINLLIIDPIMLFIGGDTKNYNNVATALVKLNRMADLHKVTILATHHATKARTDFSFLRPQDRISGSAAFLGYSSTQIFLDTPEESGLPHYTLHIVAHTAPAQAIKLQRSATTGLFELYESSENNIEELILSSVPLKGTISTSEIVSKVLDAGFSQRTAELYLTRLKKDGLLHSAGHGKYSRSSLQPN